jgi:hypothetical protein
MWLAESQIDLLSLHAVLPLMAADPDLSRSYYRFLRRVRETVHPTGASDVRLVRFDAGEIEVDLGDEAGCDLFYGLLRSAVGRDLFLSLVAPDDTVVDVGAGFGPYALACGGIVSRGDGVVHAFDARPDLLAILERNVERLDLAAAVRCHAWPVGLGSGQDLPISGDVRAAEADAVDRHEPPGLDGALSGLGAYRFGALHVAPAADVASILAGGRQIVRASPDPVILIEVDQDRLGPDGQAQLMDELAFLDDCGFAGFAVDLAGAVQSEWRVAGGLVRHAESVLFVRRAGHREELLRTLLPGSARGIRFPSIRERSSDGHGAGGPAHASVPLIAAMAVAKLRELDAITGQVGAHLTSPPTEKRSDDRGESTLVAHEPVIRAEEILSLQAEVERLLKESDVRLQDARTFRQEAKSLRSRYEVAAGQRARDLAKAIKRFVGRSTRTPPG